MMFQEEHPDYKQRVIGLTPKRFTDDPCWQTLSYGVLLIPEAHAYLKNSETAILTFSIPALDLKKSP